METTLTYKRKINILKKIIYKIKSNIKKKDYWFLNKKTYTELKLGMCSSKNSIWLERLCIIVFGPGDSKVYMRKN